MTAWRRTVGISEKGLTASAWRFRQNMHWLTGLVQTATGLSRELRQRPATQRQAHRAVMDQESRSRILVLTIDFPKP